MLHLFWTCMEGHLTMCSSSSCGAIAQSTLLFVCIHLCNHVDACAHVPVQAWQHDQCPCDWDMRRMPRARGIQQLSMRIIRNVIQASFKYTIIIAEVRVVKGTKKKKGSYCAKCWSPYLQLLQDHELGELSSEIPKAQSQVLPL